MFSPYQYWTDLYQLLSNPKQVMFGFAEWLLSWVSTRHWGVITAIIPIVLVVGYSFGCSVYLRWIGPGELILKYWSYIEKDSAAKSTLLRSESQAVDDSEDEQKATRLSLTSEEELSPVSAMLLMKILQLESSDARAAYLVGSVLAQQGRLGQARQIMRRIAPAGERGFPAAYAWLAADRIQTLGVNDRPELIALLDDLAEARRWPSVEPMLMSTYADVLLKENNSEAAIEVLTEIGRRDSRFKIKLAGVLKQLGRLELLDLLTKEMVEQRMGRIELGKGSEQDFVEVVSLRLISEDTEGAVNLAQKGLKDYPKSPQLARLLSNGYMLSYEKAVKNNAPSAQRMEFLDAAMKSDSTNPAVTEKIAKLTSEEQDLNEELAAFLREQLAANKATAVTHLLLAVGELRKQELEKAIVHLEVARGLSPNNPVILNNLALAIARVRPEEIVKARQLAEQALKVGGADAEVLDTYGEILSMMREYTVAIRAFETALSVNQDRPGTRKKLADAYIQVSMPEMAEAVRKKGEEVAAEKLKREAEVSASSESAKDQATATDAGNNTEAKAPGDMPAPNSGNEVNKSDPATPGSTTLPNGLIKKEELVPSEPK